MTMPRLALVLAPFVLALANAACASPSTPGDPAYADVVFQGSATDAALTAMLAAKAADTPALAAYFDTPKSLTELPSSPIITFTWHDGQSAAMQLLPRPRARSSFAGVLSDLLGERSAHAGGASMTGKGYLLEFRTLDTNQALFRVFTSATAYTPAPKEWAKIATSTWTQLQIVSATFGDDQVTAGPYDGQLIEFCVGSWQ
jgi:hypothetical protein